MKYIQKKPKKLTNIIQQKHTANILYNGTMWNMYQIFCNGDFVCMSAHPEKNKNIKRYGISKEEIINKIIEDDRNIISSTLTLSGLQWSR